LLTYWSSRDGQRELFTSFAVSGAILYVELSVVANRDELLQVADECVVLSTKIADVDAAAKLLQIAIRVLRVADPVLPPDADLDIAAFNPQQMFGAAEGVPAS
jgi:hypothetical protein